MTIYEGTTAIQANDLLGRKTLRDGGQFARRLSDIIEETLQELGLQSNEDLQVMHAQLTLSKAHFEQAVRFMLEHAKDAPNVVYAGSVPYLMLTSMVVVGWLYAKSMLVSRAQIERFDDVAFYRAKIKTARFFAEHLLTQTGSALHSIVKGAQSVNALAVEDF